MTPRLLLRLEGLALLAVSTPAYFALGGTAGWFAALLLAPDLSMLGYLAGPRVGAAAYNAAHTQLGPLALGALALGAGPPSLLLGGLIWAAHIGLDRALGYGLKHASGFHHTHLGPSHAHAHARARRQPTP